MNKKKRNRNKEDYGCQSLGEEELGAAFFGYRVLFGE